MDQTDSKKYHRVKYQLFYGHLLWNFAWLGFLALSGWSTELRDWAAETVQHPILLNCLYLLVFSVVLYLLNLPLNYFEEFVWEHRFKLSNQSLGAWIKDDLKKGSIGLIFFLVIVEVVYLFLGKFPETWWLFAAAFYLGMTLLIARILPTVIIPIFYKYSAVENQELKEKVLELFRRAQVSIQNVYVINLSAKTKKANAFICGLGQSRRVVLSDTLLADFSAVEIETIVAHEIGHHKNKDILKLTFINSALTLFGFYIMHRLLAVLLPWFGLQRIDDIAFFPVVIMLFYIFGLILSPLLNFYSRTIEVEADRYSLVLTGKPEAFIQMMKKLGQMNLAELEPSRFNEIMFYDHPTIAKRIQFAKGFQPKTL